MPVHSFPPHSPPRLAGATPELLQRSAAALLELLEAAPLPVARCLSGYLAPLQALMLSRPASEEATQLSLCRILAFASCASASADGGAGGTGDGAGGEGGGEASRLIGQLLPLLPSTDLTGCVGTNEQRKVVGAALGLGHVAAAATRPASLLPANESLARFDRPLIDGALLTAVASALANLVRPMHSIFHGPCLSKPLRSTLRSTLHSSLRSPFHSPFCGPFYSLFTAL